MAITKSGQQIVIHGPKSEILTLADILRDDTQALSDDGERGWYTSGTWHWQAAYANTGTANRIIQWDNANTIEDSTLEKTGNGLLTLNSIDNNTLGISGSSSIQGHLIGGGTLVLNGRNVTVPDNGIMALGEISPGQIGYGSAGSALTSGSTLTWSGSVLELGDVTSGEKVDTNGLLRLYGRNTQPAFYGFRSNGSAGAETQMLTGQNMFALTARAYNGTGSGSAAGFTGLAGMSFISAENHTPTAMGTYIFWAVTPIGSILPAERMRLSPSGNLLLGTTTSPTSAFSTLAIANATPPSAGTTNVATLYSNDLAAGNAWLHTRGEAGIGRPLTAGSGLNGQLAVWASGSAVLDYITTYERHIQIPAFTSGAVANQPTPVDFNTVGGLQFNNIGSKYSFCQWEIPDDWDSNDIYIEVDWFPDSALMTGTNTVKWALEYRSIAEGELISNGSSVTTSGSYSGYLARYGTKHTRITIPATTGNQPLTKQDHIYFKFSRDNTVANNWGGTVTVPAFEIIYNSTGLPTSG